MKIAIASLVLTAFVSMGCQDNKKMASQSNPAVTDFTAPAPAVAYPAVSVTPSQPVMVEPAVSATPISDTRAVAVTGGTYTVKKGDSLFGIAKAKYGNGNQWKKIAAANPGVSPTTLKVGQTLTLPS